MKEALGSGGMATVFRAEDTVLRREVAIKVLYPQLSVRADLLLRFQREARAAAALDHPNILRIFDVGESEAVPFIVMELVRGRTLGDFLQAHGAPVAEVVAMVGAVLARALEVAHRAGVVHRDVKPGNIMIAEGGRLVLCDFGLARISEDDALVTQSGATLGTPSFMAPEQALGRTVDARSDVYGLGATLYQVATGAPPFSGPTPAVLVAVSRGEWMPPLRRNAAVGSALAAIIERAMAREPAARFASAAELGLALDEVCASAGLGELNSELAAYFRSPPDWNREALPRILEAHLARAEELARQRAFAKALALCDRILSLDPDHPEAKAIVASVGKSGSRRAALRVAAAAGALLGTAGIVWVVAEPMVSVEAPDAGSSDAATLPDATAAMADGEVRPLADAGGTPTSRERPRPESRARALASIQPPDAGVAARRPQPGQLIVAVRPWCDITVDGVAHGRSPRTEPIELEPGDHEVICRQPGGRALRQTVPVAAGETSRMTGSLVEPVDVLVDGEGIKIDGVHRERGASVRLGPGRHRVETSDATTWVTIPDRPCTLRLEPVVACY